MKWCNVHYQKILLEVQQKWKQVGTYRVAALNGSTLIVG